MFNITKNGIISVTRGDYFSLPLFINQGTKCTPIRYSLKDGDIIYVGVEYPNQPFENAIIRKKYTNEDVNENGDVIVTFESKDTQFLTPGKYYYEIKLLRENNIVDTVVPRTLFNIW